MKKLLIFLLLMVFSLGFSQEEFTKYYSHTAIKYPNQTEKYKFYESKGAVRFNVSDSKLIIVYTPAGNIVLTPLKSAVKTSESQDIKVMDKDGQIGLISLFNDEKYGCLIIFPDVHMAFVNL